MKQFNEAMFLTSIILSIITIYALVPAFKYGSTGQFVCAVIVTIVVVANVLIIDYHQ